MQPIILLGIVAAGAIAMSSGFLAPAIENIWVQSLGVGAADLASPVDHVAVDLDVGPSLVDPDASIVGDEYFKNAVLSCSWHIGTDDLAVVMDPDGQPNSGDEILEEDINEVICKITDADSKAIAECGITYPSTLGIDYPFSQHQECVPDEAFPGALDIDNVEDVRIVVRGANPTEGQIP